MPSHLAICWCPEADITRELEWYICCRIYATLRGAPYPARQKVVIFWDFFSLGK